jgi:hypothetical protein
MAAEQVRRRIGRVADQAAEIYGHGQGQGNNVRLSARILEMDLEPSSFDQSYGPHYLFGFKPRPEPARLHPSLHSAFSTGRQLSVLL